MGHALRFATSQIIEIVTVFLIHPGGRGTCVHNNTCDAHRWKPYRRLQVVSHRENTSLSIFCRKGVPLRSVATPKMWHISQAMQAAPPAMQRTRVICYASAQCHHVSKTLEYMTGGKWLNTCIHVSDRGRRDALVDANNFPQ